MSGEEDEERERRRQLRRLLVRDAARRQREDRHRVHAMLGEEDWALFSAFRAGLEAEAGHSVGAAEVVREAVRRGAAAIAQGGVL
jgi:hypothetical protein